jgi:hypothetical protein
MNEDNCKRQMQQMTVFSRDDASRKRAATTAKAFMCRGGASTKCELDVCLYACGVLGDADCTRQYQYLRDFGPRSK